MKHIVYQITNLINDRIYIGVHATKNPDVFDGYLGSGKIMKQAIDKYGKNTFIRETLHCFENLKEAYLKECTIVNEDFVNREDTYNLSLGGYGSFLGQHHSEESKKKISESNKGRVVSKETRKKISESEKGKTVSEETKKKLSKAQMGKYHSEASRKKISEFQTGRSVSRETRKKLSIVNTGKRHSEETKQKLSKAGKGKIYIHLNNKQINSCVCKEELDNYLNNGWQIGRKRFYFSSTEEVI